MTSFVKVCGHTDNWDIWFLPANVAAISCNKGQSVFHVYTTNSDDPFVFNFTDEAQRDLEAARFMNAICLRYS